MCYKRKKKEKRSKLINVRFTLFNQKSPKQRMQKKVIINEFPGVAWVAKCHTYTHTATRFDRSWLIFITIVHGKVWIEVVCWQCKSTICLFEVWSFRCWAWMICWKKCSNWSFCVTRRCLILMVLSARSRFGFILPYRVVTKLVS